MLLSPANWPRARLELAGMAVSQPLALAALLSGLWLPVVRAEPLAPAFVRKIVELQVDLPVQSPV